MTPEEVAELYLTQHDWTYEQSVLYSAEWGLTNWGRVRNLSADPA
jgi:hypothetical protein